MGIQNVTVIGAGTMGHALALVHALGGLKVSLFDVSPEVLSRARMLIASACETLQEAGSIDAVQGQAATNGITFCSSLAEALGAADLMVEAVVEKEDVKREVFADADLHAPAHAIFASNSSYLDIFPLLPERRQERAVIAHWYAPPYVIDLVDLVPGPRCAPSTLEAVEALYSGMGKTTLVFPEMVPGYIANRLQSALNLECLRMIDENMASAHQIDLAIRSGLAVRLAVLGHMRKADYTGLAMMQNGLASRRYMPPEQKGGSSTLSRLIAEGRTGVVAGAGFYDDYGGTPPDVLFRQRDIKLLKLKRAVELIEKEGEA